MSRAVFVVEDIESVFAFPTLDEACETASIHIILKQLMTLSQSHACYVDVFSCQCAGFIRWLYGLFVFSTAHIQILFFHIFYL